MEQRLTFDAEDGSPRVISAAAPVQTAAEEEAVAADAHFAGEEEEEGYEGSEDDFEFSFVPREITDADDIFADGRIRAAYPVVFNRDVAEASAVGFPPFAKLRIDEERDRDAASMSSCSCSSSESDDLEGEAFCLWRPAPPSPDMTKKSNSTGRMSRRWRIRDFVVGRSHSDGKEKFVYLPMAAPRKAGEDRKASALRPRKAGEEEVLAAAAQGKKAAGGKQGKGGGEMDMVTAHRLYYAKGGAHDRRQTYLPYRKDLVGFFGGVHGSTRSAFNPF